MAAITETAATRRDFVLGNMRAVKVDVTSVDDADTWDPGLAIIEHFDFRPTTAAATTQWGATIAQGTAGGANQARVTFVLESGTLAGSVVAYGY